MNSKIRSDFPVTRELTYLDTAYDGPYPLPVLEAGLRAEKRGCWVYDGSDAGADGPAMNRVRRFGDVVSRREATRVGIHLA